jgi:hypothetical protein
MEPGPCRFSFTRKERGSSMFIALACLLSGFFMLLVALRSRGLQQWGLILITILCISGFLYFLHLAHA